LYHCRMWCYAIGVEAVVLRSWCVILCTVCQLVYLHQVGTSSLLIYMMHGHTYIRLNDSWVRHNPQALQCRLEKKKWKTLWKIFSWNSAGHDKNVMGECWDVEEMTGGSQNIMQYSNHKNWREGKKVSSGQTECNVWLICCQRRRVKGGRCRKVPLSLYLSFYL